MKREPTQTGLVCPQCSAASGEVELQAQHVIWFLCRSCKHRWVADQSSPSYAEQLRFRGVAPTQSVAADRKRK